MTLNPLSSQPTPAADSVAHTGLSAANAGMDSLYQPVDVHYALNAVRQMPEFQPHQPNWLEELWKQPLIKKLSHEIGHLFQQSLQRLMAWMSKLTPTGLAHLPENIRDIFSGFVGFILVLVGLFVLYLVLGWLLQLKEKSSHKHSSEVRLLEHMVLVNSVHHYQQAQIAAEIEDYEMALRQLYMATLCLLDERKVAPYEATRTNLEYLALLEQGQDAVANAQGAMKGSFERMARQFESVRYGLRPISLGQFEQSRSDYQAMQAMAESWVHG
jgi:hypothetical protein